MTPTLDANWTWKSWIDSANEPGCGYPLQNLPFCAFQAADGTAHLGVGIGRLILDLHACSSAGLLDGLPETIRAACRARRLNGLMECEREPVASLRRALMMLLRAGADRADIDRVQRWLVPQEGAIFEKPVLVGNYTDFYASIHHALNVGRLFRPDQPLLPNYKYIPIGYHGRVSSLVLSGTSVTRPCGQRKPPDAAVPSFEASRQMDYELEVAAYIGTGNALGHPIPIADAENHLFGISLLNDWSARDIQAWEYQPLGPFLGKNFATAISPWVVSMDALAPFRVCPAPRAAGDPAALPYLSQPETAATGIDARLEVHLSTAAMREKSLPPMRLSAGNLRDLYWSFAQMVAHHSSNGCNLMAGDLIASGTVSGEREDARGCLLEITQRGGKPLHLPGGEVRSFLEDGDEIVLSGFCEREGLPRIGLGECRGTIVPALPMQ